MSDHPQQRPHVASTAVKVVIFAFFTYPLLHYAVFDRAPSGAAPPETPNNSTAINQTTETPLVRKRTPPQPVCLLLFHQRAILASICEELFLKHEQCTPEDVHNEEKHRPPRLAKNNTATGEPRGTIVGCVAAGLLLTSLGAAFVELYKAKSQTPKKAKPPMSRKCSLADLTVLKHNRKELVRRESILEIPEAGGSSKQLGFRPPPLHRRCSFPVGPSEFCYNESRRTSMVDSRRLSIIDSRRSSVDCRKPSIDGRRISIDNESPERRHWSRLVHRH